MAAFAVVPTAPAAAEGAAAGDPDPSNWSNRRLARQLVIAGVDMHDLSRARDWAEKNIGGIVLFGNPPENLGDRLERVRSAGSIPPLVASDEEGGQVQRLASVIRPLHSAEWFGQHRSPDEVEDIARRYAKKMHALGVDVDLAPVADLLVPGYFIASQHRAFGKKPRKVRHYVNAWRRGMTAAHVATTVKHWPGHGHATDTHTGAARTPPLSDLEDRDMKPFESAFEHHVPMVMVGHLLVPGLTKHGNPASVSKRALHYLRDQAGPDVLVVTDMLVMGAVQAAGYSPAEAAVRALTAGADLAMVQRPGKAIDAITEALDSGDYPRKRAVASAHRVLAVKQLTGSLPS